MASDEGSHTAESLDDFWNWVEDEVISVRLQALGLNSWEEAVALKKVELNGFVAPSYSEVVLS